MRKQEPKRDQGPLPQTVLLRQNCAAFSSVASSRDRMLRVKRVRQDRTYSRCHLTIAGYLLMISAHPLAANSRTNCSTIAS
jgi:hypothetical protein